MYAAAAAMSPDQAWWIQICPLGHVRVVVVVDVDVGELRQLVQRVRRQLDLLRLRRVQVEDPVLHQPEARCSRGSRRGSRPCPCTSTATASPKGSTSCTGLSWNVVLPPGDAGRVDRVRHRVLPLLVVPGVREVRPGLGDVRDVAVVERPDQLGLDQRARARPPSGRRRRRTRRSGASLSPPPSC